MKRLIAGFTCGVVLGLSAPALAHHSAAGIDRTKSVTLVGTVREFGWRNPHSYMEVDVPTDAGGMVTWKVEMTSPAFLVRAGWKSNTLKPGDKVSVVVRPLVSGDPGGIFVSVKLASGQVLGERAVAPATPATP